MKYLSSLMNFSSWFEYKNAKVLTYFNEGGSFLKQHGSHSICPTQEAFLALFAQASLATLHLTQN